MRRRFLIHAFLAIALLLSACVSAETDVSTTASTSEIVFTLPPANEDLPAEPLRIWSTSRATHHPIRVNIDNDYQNVAIDALLYDPLWTYDNDGTLVYRLAKQVTWNEAGTMLTIAVRDDVVFSNGQALTSNDVVVSLRTLRASVLGDEYDVLETDGDGDTGSAMPAEEEDEPEEATGETAQDEAGAPETPLIERNRRFTTRKDCMITITRIQENAAGDVEISFSNTVDNALGFLICPILPAVEASNLYAATAPGTGTYVIAATGDHEGYQLTPRRDDYVTIDVEIADDIGDAMQKFQQGELDLLLMNANEYALYGGRQNVRFQGLSTNAFTYLRMNVRSGLFADEFELNYFLDLSVWQQNQLENAAFLHWSSMVPVGRDDHRFPFQANLAVREAEPQRRDLEDVSVRLVRGRSTFDAELAENIRLFLERLGYRVQMVVRSEQNPDPDGDIYLTTYSFEGYPDAYEFFLRADAGQYHIILDGYPELNSILIKMRSYIDEFDTDKTLILQQDKERYADAIVTLMSEIPVIGVAIPSAGIAYGPRVEGQLKTAYASPYEGVWELTLWPIP